ncbi:A disintegrin and metalloproteinase with thrombospondin motifs 20 [Orchesella cincta]|uniref:A disintegrin and metalloproteinase with thrombospondin motifs 20 n=1 Tax=Orchesella cincta TaxID=48709 RepID=A0A1D2M4E4_ORCCI|nr:A disintegrin and metalloproteinase with thrombospondin motifs 20 [Orchesella cincta]
MIPSEKPSENSSSCYTIHTLDSRRVRLQNLKRGLSPRAQVNDTQIPTPVKFDYNQEPNELVPQTSEYVRLYKLPPPLDNDDINEKYSHHRFSIHHYYNTGVFRPPKSKLWDPHPQYIFHAFNKRFHVVLNQISKKHSLFIPGFKVTTHSGNDRSHGCKRDNHDNASTLLHRASRAEQPPSTRSTDRARPQHADARPDADDRNARPRSRSRTRPYYSDEDYDSEEENLKARSKRSLSTERYVELTVVTDQTMSSYHGDNLKHYVLTLLSIVALVYRDASIGNPVNIVLVNFHVLTDTDFSGNSQNKTHGTSASEMLRNFCKWQKEHNHPDDRHALHRRHGAPPNPGNHMQKPVGGKVRHSRPS